MSKRFLKYETEQNNPNVDENGVLKNEGNVIEIHPSDGRFVLNGITYDCYMEFESNDCIITNLKDNYYKIIPFLTLGSVVCWFDEYDECMDSESIVIDKTCINDYTTLTIITLGLIKRIQLSDQQDA